LEERRREKEVTLSVGERKQRKAPHNRVKKQDERAREGRDSESDGFNERM